MSKVTIIAILAVVSIIGLLAATALTKDKEPTILANSLVEQGATDQQTLMHKEYPNVPETNRFVRKSFDDTMNILENETGIVFLGFKECPWCQKMAPIINEVAEAEGVSVHYLDIKKLSTDDQESYQTLLSYLSPHLSKNESGQVRISTPDISFVKNGKIIWRYEMDAVTDEERNPETYWTESRRERTINDFREQISKLKEG